MGMVDADLYLFLLNHECHVFKRNDRVISWVAINFCDIEEFQKIVGRDHFVGGLCDVTLMPDYIAVELNDIIDGTGTELRDYKNCFDKDDQKMIERGGVDND